MNPRHRTGLARISNFLVTPRHLSFSFLAFSFEAVRGLSPANIHATCFALVHVESVLPKRGVYLVEEVVACSWKSFCLVKLIIQLQPSTYETPSGSSRKALAIVRANRTGEHGDPGELRS
jgi:hypothetical protein